MGFFSKIKQNLNHGGVDISLAAPTELTASDTQLSAQVTLICKDQPRQVNKISLKLVQIQDSQVSGQDEFGAQPMKDEYVLGENSMTQAFTLQPGQPVSLPISLSFQLGTFSSSSDNPLMQTLGQSAENMQKIGNILGGKSLQHKLTALADVEGIALDPAVSQDMNITHVNQF